MVLLQERENVTCNQNTEIVVTTERIARVVLHGAGAPDPCGRGRAQALA